LIKYEYFTFFGFALQDVDLRNVTIVEYIYIFVYIELIMLYVLNLIWIAD